MSDDKVSFRGRLARESIRKFMAIPLIKVNGFLKIGVKLCKRSFWHAPGGYKLTKLKLDSLPLELLECNNGKKDKVIFQLHGGAYVVGYLDLYRIIALKYCKISDGASVVSIDYRIAPKYQYPSALEDAQKTWEWLLEQGYKSQDIIIAGDSAGGNLAVALTAKLRDEGKELPKALILMSPWLDLAAKGDSYFNNVKKDPIFGVNSNEPIEKELKERSLLISYAGNANAYDKYVSPIYGEFNNFPPMLIQVGTYEVLESDSITLYEKAIKANVDAKLTRYEGMFHTFQLFVDTIPESKEAWDEVEVFLKHHL